MTEGADGCNGGTAAGGYDYVIVNNGIDTEESYPYKGKDEKCKFNRTNVGVEIVAYAKIPRGDENALEKAVAVRPVTVAIDASLPSLHFYKKGIYEDECCYQNVANHIVLVVGYDVTENGTEYWIIKNSWGTGWGKDGYFWMEKGKNTCGVANSATFPVA